MARSSTKQLEKEFRELVRRWLGKAAEKYLKAALVYYQVPFPKTHNLGELLDLLSVRDRPLAEALSGCTVLNPYAAEYRYPGEAPDVPLREARKAVETAEGVGTVVEGALRKKTQKRRKMTDS